MNVWNEEKIGEKKLGFFFEKLEEQVILTCTLQKKKLRYLTT